MDEIKKKAMKERRMIEIRRQAAINRARSEGILVMTPMVKVPMFGPDGLVGHDLITVDQYLKFLDTSQ